MANLSRNFTAGKMNKVVDERLVPNGEYIDALNIRMGSTENSEVGVIENAKGNVQLSTLSYVDGTFLSNNAVCIGAIDDSANETIYWFVHDPSFTLGATGKLDLIVSYNMNTNILTYHVISIDDGSGVNTTLNFNPTYLINSVNKIDNLLFFTDNYNAPRFINVTRSYQNPIAYIDQFSAESILVIKKPPVESPSIQPVNIAGQETYMKERFICFAYRYRYTDGEYSATSQWSEPSFIPNDFSFDRDTFLNNGMVNSTNACRVTYNTGGPLVVGVDLLFKSADSPVIKVIEKLDKAELGLPDNSNQTYTFSNSKIFTVLPESELLRLYDNVPRYAEAQTLMGNRLMYSNYIEGYNLIDKNNQPTKFEYQTSLIESQIGTNDITTSLGAATYTVQSPWQTINDTDLRIDFTDILNTYGTLNAGATISIDVTIKHDKFFPPYGWLSETTDAFTISLLYTLPTTYTSVYQMQQDLTFANSIGTTTNIQTVANACLGTTFTDSFNCSIPNSLALTPSGAYYKYKSGVNALDEPIKTWSSTLDNILHFQFPAMQFVDNTSTPTSNFFEYYKIVGVNAVYSPFGVSKSLHSNRGYEVGIVYMDEFNRATTALVSPYNTVAVPCGNSWKKNSIRVTIPPTQVAPSWATRYKFVVKPDAEGYETIYSNIYYSDPSTNNVWFLVEGENARKTEVGDRYIVKADSTGPLTRCAYATVLDKEIKPSSGANPAGVYIRMLPTEFSADPAANATYTVSDNQQCASTGCEYPKISLNVFGQSIPAGTRVTMRFYWRRRGTGRSACEARSSEYNGTFISSANYNDFKEWWDGDNIAATLNSSFYACYNAACSDNYYNPNMWLYSTYGGYPVGISGYGPSLVRNYFSFQKNPSGDVENLWVTGTEACTGINPASANRVSYLEGSITINRGSNLMIFETLPLDANPDIFFENNLSFAINSNGEHQGNVQNQDFALNQPAIIDTGFYNCFAFGNGDESYKIRDSLIGHQFGLGNRVTSVAAQDYKEAHRYADITYSGIYNNESNVNKLNEFNLGLLDFKKLETSFGPVFRIDGRETDVLVLQEDKISYVLAGKNLLSDAAAGGAITSVPEVLGTQIARVEKYGISMNPESYVHWGQNRFFTDAKRGAVIQIAGDSYQSDQLKVISEVGMRTWFRDNFIEYFNTQKLGGFDPYLNEYVLSTNDKLLPQEVECLECGMTQTFNVSSENRTFCVDLGQAIGASTVTWVVNYSSGDPFDSFTIESDYNGTIVSSGPTTTSGSFIVDKNNNLINTVQMSLDVVGSFNISITVECPEVTELTIVEIVLTSDSDSGKSIHTQYRYFDGLYTSPVQSSNVIFSSGISNPLVSKYSTVSGYVGSSGFPTEGSTMRLMTNKVNPTDNFDFNVLTNRFKYLMSDTLYGNTSSEMNGLISILNDATPIFTAAPLHYSDFVVPTLKNYLYLVWDLREPSQKLLCFSEKTSDDACCGCSSCTTECVTITMTNSSEQYEATLVFQNGICGDGTPVEITLDPAEKQSICVVNAVELFTVTYGNPIVTIDNCDCGF